MLLFHSSVHSTPVITVNNLQIEVSDDSATLYAYVMFNNFMPREGCRRGSENALLMNRYDCELVRDGHKWRFKRVTIDNAWRRAIRKFLTPSRFGAL